MFVVVSLFVGDTAVVCGMLFVGVCRCSSLFVAAVGCCLLFVAWK